MSVMSTLTQGLDFYDETVFDPLAESHDDDSRLKIDIKESLGKDEGKEEEEEEDDEDAYEEEVISEKEEEVSKEFTTRLWSDESTVSSRSEDVWDIPARPIFWDENEKPIERLLSYADLRLTPEEEGGLLTDRIVAACSTYLTESPGNKCHILAKVVLNNKNLNDIRILSHHRFLQYIDLSWNNLTNLTPLGSIPYLMYLDVSHNLLESVLDFKPPKNLTYVNYSYNQVWQIKDLSDFWSLTYLDLSHNKISKIQGFQNLRYLRHLDLSYNKISEFENLDNLRITDLNLEYNIISRFQKNMKTMPHLTNLYLNNNLITSLEFLKVAYHLKKLELQGNDISDLVELTNLKTLKYLRCLNLSNNPIGEKKPYRQLLLNLLQDLKFIDEIEVDISERVAACKKNKFNVQLEAAKNNARMILLEQLNDTCLDLDVLPVDQGPYPFVILVGPSASFKKTIVQALAKKYPEKIYVGKLHTTRELDDFETQMFVHVNLEEFNESVKAGKFLCVMEKLGHFYGFGREELGTAIKERKLCLTSMDMVGALTIHAYGIRPYLILAILESEETHMDRLNAIYGPVVNTVGTAYVVQKKLLDNHVSNVGLVKSMLDEVVDNAVEQDMTTLFQTESRKSSVDLNPVWGGSASFQQFSDPYYDVTRTPSPMDSEFKEYKKAKPCNYTCKQTGCLYQEMLPDVMDAFFSTCDDVNIDRLTASELTAEESSSTSYSNCQLPAHLSEFPTVSTKNADFSEWSMPQIDWSAFNLTGLQLEQAAQLLVNKYIEGVASTRDDYQSLHLENPGLFSLSVFTDDLNKAIKTISKFLKRTWRSTPELLPIHSVEEDLIRQEYVPRKLDKLKEMLRKDFFSADGDGCLKNLSITPINSPRTICAEMRMKGYGDSSGSTRT